MNMSIAKKIRRHEITAARRARGSDGSEIRVWSCSSGPAAAACLDHCRPSDLGVPLHVKCFHLVEDERDGMLADEADVSTQCRQLFALKLHSTAQLLVFSQQLVACLSTTRINVLRDGHEMHSV